MAEELFNALPFYLGCYSIFKKIVDYLK